MCTGEKEYWVDRKFPGEWQYGHGREWIQGVGQGFKDEQDKKA